MWSRITEMDWNVGEVLELYGCGFRVFFLGLWYHSCVAFPSHCWYNLFYRCEQSSHLELGLLSADAGIWSDLRFVLPGLGFTTCSQLISLARKSVFMSIIFVLHLTCVVSWQSTMGWTQILKGYNKNWTAEPEGRTKLSFSYCKAPKQEITNFFYKFGVIVLAVSCSTYHLFTRISIPLQSAVLSHTKVGLFKKNKK